MKILHQKRPALARRDRILIVATGTPADVVKVVDFSSVFCFLRSYFSPSLEIRIILKNCSKKTCEI
jgi:hypothetical protein